MKKIDLKSFTAGLLIGTLGITTAFAAAGILSADLCDTKVTLKGAPLSLNHPLISVTMEDGQEPKLYMPADELLTSLGYTLHYDNGKNTVDLLPGNASLPDAVSYGNGDSVIALANRPEQRNIAESGAFQAEDNQTLILEITSDIKGGSVDFFLFDPNGKEQHIVIESSDIVKEIPLEKGLWKYNCSGIFKEGGNVKLIGTIR